MVEATLDPGASAARAAQADGVNRRSKPDRIGNPSWRKFIEFRRSIIQTPFALGDYG